MDYDVNNPIHPMNRMPVPNEYFFILMRQGSGASLVPAILKCYCDYGTFYDNCAILSKGGYTFKMDDTMVPLGWVEMFNKTKTFKIDHI